MKQIIHTICIFIRSQQAEIGPPLGTVLGNLGLNATKFCKEFNDLTQELPSYFLLRVAIHIFDDKSFSIEVDTPTVGFILSLLKFERIVKVSGRTVTEQCITLRSLIELALFKLPQKSLQVAVPTILGTVLAARIKVV